MRIVGAIRSEMIKQFSTSVWWILLIVLVVYVGGTAGALAAAFGANTAGVLPGASLPPQLGERLPSLVYGVAASIGYVFPLIVGTLLVTGEFRHKTLTPTFLATPRRGLALAAKVIAGVALGALYGAASIVAAIGLGAAALALFGVDTQLDRPETWAAAGRMLLALTLWLLMGIGLGALIRNQIGAVVGVLAFTQFVEPIARVGAGVVDGASDVVRFLPGAVSDALAGDSIFSVVGGASSEPLEWWVGGLVLAGYAAVLLVVGHLVSWRRDVV